jgi:hypothetical protein
VSGYGFAVIACVVVAAVVFGLLRTRRMREKYAGIWIVLALVNIVLVAFPGLSIRIAELVGVQTPVNLLFASAFVVLLVVCIHLSTEMTQIEEQARTVAEEVALLRLDVEESLRGVRDRTPGPADHRPDEPSA